MPREPRLSTVFKDVGRWLKEYERRKTYEEKRYFEVTPGQRATMAVLYFGLVALLVAGMSATHIQPQR
jgi:hypothetical protein